MSTPSIRWLYDENVLTGIGKVIVYGVGKNVHVVCDLLASHGVSIACFCDDDESRIGSLCRGERVISVGELAGYRQSTPIVVSSTLYFFDIASRLLEAGFDNILCSYKENPGVLWPLSDVASFHPECYSAVLVLPPDKNSADYVIRGIRWFRECFKKAQNLTFTATDEHVPYYSDLLPDADVVTYNRTEILDRYDVLVFMSRLDYSTVPTDFDVLIHQRRDLFADTIGNIYRKRVYMMLTSGCAIRCINRRTDSFTYPAINDNIFMQLSSPKPLEHFFFFPFAVLHRDSSIGPVNALGFRITEDLNLLVDRDPNHKVIAAFGGSTTYSIYCLYEEMWTQRLQEKLNDRAARHGSPLVFSILNFGQPAAVLLNSMIFYTAFCGRLKPDIVLLHDGVNDLMAGPNCDPYLLNECDMTYFGHFYEWSRLLHGTKNVHLPGHSPNTPQASVKAYLSRKKQFKAVVSGQGSTMVWGLQPFLWSKQILSADERSFAELTGTSLEQLAHFYSLLAPINHLPYADFYVNLHEKFGAIRDESTLFLGSVHTTPIGDELIADIYAEFLTERLFRDQFPTSRTADGTSRLPHTRAISCEPSQGT